MPERRLDYYEALCRVSLSVKWSFATLMLMSSTGKPPVIMIDKSDNSIKRVPALPFFVFVLFYLADANSDVSFCYFFGFSFLNVGSFCALQLGDTPPPPAPLVTMPLPLNFDSCSLFIHYPLNVVKEESSPLLKNNIKKRIRKNLRHACAGKHIRKGS